MQFFDVVILALVAVGLLWGAYVGLLRQVSRIVTFILAVYLTLVFNGIAAQALQRTIMTDSADILCRLAGGAAVFLIVWIGMFVLTRLLHRFIHTIQLQWVNRLLGAAFGGAQMVLILGVAFALLSDFEGPRKTIEQSKLAGAVAGCMELATGFIPDARARPLEDQVE